MKKNVNEENLHITHHTRSNQYNGDVVSSFRCMYTEKKHGSVHYPTLKNTTKICVFVHNYLQCVPFGLIFILYPQYKWTRFLSLSS